MRFTERKNEHLNETYYTAIHESGLKIVICPKEGFNSTYAVIGTNFGSINSTFIHDGKKVTVPAGTAHYLEHKLFESEEGDAFARYAKTGASANAYTSFDVTCYLFSCTERFDESLEILFDLMQSPYFTEETVAKEQGIIGQEIKMYQDNPEWKVMMNLLEAMYVSHPINTDIAGTVDSIAEITPEILYECYNSYYNLHNMILCIAGDVDPEEVLAVADKKLKPAVSVKTESVFPDEPYEVGKKYTEQALPVSVPMFALGYKEKAGGEFATTKEMLTTSILLEAFAGDGSALYRRLIDDKLINGTFGSEYMEGSGYRCVMFDGETKNPKEVAEIINSAVRELHKNGVPEEDFMIAKRSVYGRIARSCDSTFSLASTMINDEFTGRDSLFASEIIAGITLDDVNERLKEQLDPDNCCLSVIKGIAEYSDPQIGNA